MFSIFLQYYCHSEVTQWVRPFHMNQRAYNVVVLFTPKLIICVVVCCVEMVFYSFLLFVFLNFNRKFCKQTVQNLIAAALCGILSGSAPNAKVP